MNLCDDGHDEVCFAVRHCPVCRLKDELDDTKAEVKALEKETRR